MNPENTITQMQEDVRQEFIRIAQYDAAKLVVILNII